MRGVHHFAFKVLRRWRWKPTATGDSCEWSQWMTWDYTATFCVACRVIREARTDDNRREDHFRVEVLQAVRDEAAEVLRRIKEIADAGDPSGGCLEDAMTGERIWKVWIDDHLYARICRVLGEEAPHV